MRLFGKVSEICGIELQQDTTDVGEISAAIDRHFDSMLYVGMPMSQAQRIESERAKVHRTLLIEVLKDALL